MKKGTSFSPERLHKIRRMRKARRLWKQQPLFAFALLQQEYPGYTHTQFLIDVRRRSRHKKRRHRPFLSRFGRYLRMQQLALSFTLQGNLAAGRQALMLRRNMTRPYRLLTQTRQGLMEFTFCPLIPIQEIEQLSASIRSCNTNSEVEKAIQAFRDTHRIGMH